jgi:hypothetical protein
MKRFTTSLMTLTLALCAMIPSAARGQQTADAKIAEAMKAAPADLAHHATIMDWDQSILREGTNGWTCLPTPPQMPGSAPMCLDGQWMQWAHAWMTKTEPTVTEIGVSYMLSGDDGASNSDPYGTRENSTDWVVTGPHLMILTPDLATLDGMTTDPDNGGPWVMWKGTPYAHIMVPVGDMK